MTVVAAAAAVFRSDEIVFCVSVWFTLAVAIEIPITEAAVVVPVPPEPVRLRIVFEVNVHGVVTVIIPMTWDAAAVEVFRIESATVPPMMLDVARKVFPMTVSARIP